MRGRSHVAAPRIGHLLTLLIVVLCVCEHSDAVECVKAHTFTPCNPDTQTMYSIEYYANECTPAADTALRAPQSTPCSLPCDSGWWYSPETVGCKRCQRGYHSNSGGRIVNDFRIFPSGFVTYCSPQPCNAWVSSETGAFIDSGNQSVGVRHGTYGHYADETVESVLSTVATVINPIGGKVIFSYRVESEKGFDGLTVFLNGTAYLPDKKSRFFATGFDLSWKEQIIPLPIGVTEIKWVYSKDQNQESSYGHLAGMDRAFLSAITIEGVQMFAPSCVRCAAGTFCSAEGCMSCSTCKKNEKSVAGSSECEVCKSNEWAPPGSAKCFTRQGCLPIDYVATYDACANGKRRRTWKLVSEICEEGANRPKEDTVDCAACMPGFALVSGRCTPCPSGMYLRGTECVACDAKTAAIPSISFPSGFDAFGGELSAQYFSSKCSGFCAACTPQTPKCENVDGGFEMTSVAVHGTTVVAIQSASATSGATVNTLTYPFSSTGSGSVKFSYFIHHTMHLPGGIVASTTSIQANAVLDGKSSPLDTTLTSAEAAGYFSVDFTSGGNHVLQIVFSNSNGVSHDPVELAILSLTVIGDTRGSAATCQQCIEGHYCPEKTAAYIPCSPGEAMGSKLADKCTSCVGNTFAKDEGAISCKGCPTGTHANAAHTNCINECNITLGTYYFNLTALRGVSFGPIYATRDTGITDPDRFNIPRFFVSMCSFVNENNAISTCPFKNGEKVENAFSCQRINENVSYSAGDEVRYAIQQGKLKVSFIGGDRCRSGEERVTDVTMVCDPDEEAFPGRLDYISEDPHCTYNFMFTSRLSCPVCQVDSFTRSEGPCRKADKQKEITYFKKSQVSNCVGGYQPPKPENISCRPCLPDSYETVWGECIKGVQERVVALKRDSIGCTEDGSTMPTIAPGNTTQFCSVIDASIGRNRFTMAVVLIAFAALLLVTAIGFLALRHRSLSIKYERLATNARNDEMGEVNYDAENQAASAKPEDS